MSIEADMSTPVTRGEMIDAMSTMAHGLIEQIEIRLQALRRELRQELRQDIRQDILQELKQDILPKFREEFRQDLLEELRQDILPKFREELNKDMAHHIGAYHEAMLTQIAVIDEKYADLPGRMARLEAKLNDEPS